MSKAARCVDGALAKTFPVLLHRRAGFSTDCTRIRSRAMKETKFFRKQAAKAERMAQTASDAEVSQSFLNMARAYRSQADVLKAKKKSGKKRRNSS